MLPHEAWAPRERRHHEGMPRLGTQPGSGLPQMVGQQHHPDWPGLQFGCARVPTPRSLGSWEFSKLGSAALLPGVLLVKALSAESCQLVCVACCQALAIGLVPRRGGGAGPPEAGMILKGTCVVHAVFKQRTGTLSSASGSETRGSPGGVQRTLGAPGCPVPISLSQLSAPALSDLGLDVCWPVQEGDELYTKVAAEPA